jgi:putative nucleotidyltransferase with HDIG domain
MESIEKKDHYTNQHCLKVLELAREMAKRMKLNGKESYAFVTAARYHDLGKISISDEILNKPGALTEVQFNDMKSHVLETRRLLSENFEEEVCLIAEQHHERLNGSGYPYGLKAKDIHEHAKALAVLDTFDAMTTDRVYKKGKTREEAFLELYSLADTYYERKYIEMLELIIFKTEHPE